MLIDELAGLGEGLVRYNWLVGKLITPPWVRRKSIPNTTGKRIFLMKTSCTRNVASLIAIDIAVLPSVVRGLSSALEIENSVGSIGGTKERE